MRTPQITARSLRKNKTDGEEPAEQEEAEGAGDAPEDPEQE